VRWVAGALFAGVFLVQLAWAPLDLRGMGYSGNEVAASFSMIAWLSGDLAGVPASQLLGTEGLVSMHGIVETLVKLPFALAGSALAPLFPASPRFAERFVAVVPLLETALLATLLFSWATRITGDLRWGLTVALGAAFCTLLWPYAYIGLEPTQALALLVTGHLALVAEPHAPRSGRALLRTCAFVLLAGLTVTIKRTGLLLLPAVAYLTFEYFRRQAPLASRWRRLSAPLLGLLGILAVNYGNHLLRADYYSDWANAAFLRRFLETNPVRLASHVLNLLFSGNKGLIVFAPVAALALTALPAAWRKHRELAIFALLVLASLLGGFAVVGIPSDETWGPRYLYCAIPPLLLCLASAWGGERLATYRKLGLAFALLVGFGASALGTMFYYGRVLQAAQSTRQSTLEALWADPVWNAVTMNLRLTRLWLAPEGTSTVWTPQHKWWFEPPRNLPPDLSYDFGPVLEPQPLLLRPGTRKRPVLLGLLSGSLLAGLAALGMAASRARRAPRLP
jgi:hypothetical protein